MSLRDEVDRGLHDALLFGGGTSSLVESDPIVGAEEDALAGLVAGDQFLEAIISGPYGASAVATGGTSRLAALAAESAGWMRASGESSAASLYFGRSRSQLLDYLYWLYGHHPIARNVIGHYVNLTIGEGFRVVWKDVKKRERWAKIAKKVGWNRRVRKLVKHTYLLGEWFSVVVPITRRMAVQDGKLVAEQVRGAGGAERQLRGLGPENIERVIVQGDPTYDAANVGNPDVETVLGYKRTEGATVLAPEDVVHHRAEEVANLPHGVSILFPVLRYLRFFEKFVEDRYHLNHIRARIPAVRKVIGGAAQTRKVANALATLPKPGSLITENGNVEWQFPEMNIDSQDAVEDGRLIIMSIAAGTQLPTYLITSDPANTNYASLMAADSPTIAVFEGLQEDVWIPDLCQLVSMLSGEDEGAFEVIAGAVIKRNIKTISDGYAVLVDRKIMSRQTVAEKMDLDWAKEQERIEDEGALEQGFRTNAGMNEPGAPPAPGKKKGGRPQNPDNPGDDGQGNRRPRPSDRG